MSRVCDFLFVDTDDKTLKILGSIADKQGWRHQSTNSGNQALGLLEVKDFKVLVLDTKIDDLTGLQILEWLKTLPHSPEVVFLTADNSAETAIKALKMGAFDYQIKKEVFEDRILSSMTQALDKFNISSRLRVMEKSKDADLHFGSIIGSSSKMQAIIEIVNNVALSDSNVLIQGESGTGKELIAQAIHRYGKRKNDPFVVINCAAMPETLFESELFGYTKGAFTGAANDKEGLFEAANGGTIFLDEIGEIPLVTQVKLLRVLQEGEMRRVGDSFTRKVDVRVIAATNRILLDMIKEGSFREDLFYRLNVINIHLPPLRERPEDITTLAYFFLKRIAEKMNQDVHRISVDALEALQGYSWPGNIRELENIIERSVVLSNSDTVTAKSLPPKILSTSFYTLPEGEDSSTQLEYKEAKVRALNIFNKTYIASLLEKNGGNITLAAEKAGMDRSNFKKIIRKYGVEVRKS